MREATLFDSPVNKRHNLIDLLAQNGPTIPAGRSVGKGIKVGESSDNPPLPKVSRIHFSVVHEIRTDTFTYIDSSKNHSRIKRNGKWIILDENHPKEVLQSRDQIYLAKSFSSGYGPLIFYQGDDCKELNDKDATQRVD